MQKLEKWIADKNFLESSDLADFLSADQRHRAVLIDFSAIEGYAGNPVKNIFNTLRIVSRYPNQILVLKGTGELVKLGGIDPNNRFALVDWYQTRDFSRFCRQVAFANAGESRYIAAINKKAADAIKHLDLMTSKMALMSDAIEELRSLVGPEALQARRNKTKLAPDAGEKIIKFICRLASTMFAKNASVPMIRGVFSEVRHYYIFRYATAYVVLALWWAGAGGANNARPEKLRNDFVDLSYITAATYFDGLLTDDKKMLDIYAETAFLIDDLFSGKLS